MDILIQSPRIKLSNRLEKIIYKKFERFGKLSDRILRCEIVLKKEKSAVNEGYLVEARLVIPGNDLFASEYGPKFEVAAEDVCLQLARQFRKRKTRLKSKKIVRRRSKTAVSDEELE